MTSSSFFTTNTRVNTINSILILTVLLNIVSENGASALHCYTCTNEQQCLNPVSEVCPPMTYCYILQVEWGIKAGTVVQRGCTGDCDFVDRPGHDCEKCYSDLCNAPFEWAYGSGQNIGTGAGMGSGASYGTGTGIGYNGGYSGGGLGITAGGYNQGGSLSGTGSKGIGYGTSDVGYGASEQQKHPYSSGGIGQGAYPTDGHDHRNGAVSYRLIISTSVFFFVLFISSII